jgi:hypothetical protein
MLDARVLDAQIVRRRVALATLDAEMTATCEVEAISVQSPAGALVDPANWDRTTSHRFLAAAMQLKGQYGPRTRRLRQKIGQLGRLMTLPIAA